MSPEEWKALRVAKEAGVAISGKDFVELSPEQWKSQKTNLPVEGRNELERAQDYTEPYTIDPRLIGAASAISAVVGGGLGSLAGRTLGAVGRGATSGALTGGLSATAGEYVREVGEDTNLARAAAIGAELAAGTLPSITREIAARAPSAAILATTQSYPLAKTIQTFSGGRSQSDILARENIFGKATIEGGTPTYNFQKEARENILEDVKSLGINVRPDENPTEALKRSLYADMDKLSIGTIEKPGVLGEKIIGSSAPVTVSAKGVREISPILNNTLESAGATPREKFAIKRILLKQTSNDPKVRQAGHQELLTLIQQGGFMEDGKVKRILKEDVQEALKTGYGNYISKTQGRDVYNKLNNAWRQEFVGKAMDDIPALITGGFKGADLEGAFLNIRQHPEGKRMLRTAIASYFKDLPEEQVAKEWVNIKRVLEGTKAIPNETIVDLNKAVNQFTSKTLGGKAKDIAGNALKMSIIKGVLPTEAAGLAQENPAREPFLM